MMDLTSIREANANPAEFRARRRAERALAPVVKMTEQIGRIAAKIDNLIVAFSADRPDTHFQRGYLAALLEVYRITSGERHPDEAVLLQIIRDAADPDRIATIGH
jgi:hypothetical protein